MVSSGERFMNFKNYNLASLYDSFMKISNRENKEVADNYDVKSVNAQVIQRLTNATKAALTA